VEAQVFGTHKSTDTQKALRFFKERRIQTHFVDLEQRAAAAGELKRFGQKFGWAALIDLGGRRAQERHVRPSGFSESQVLPLLTEDPRLLVIPLVRVGNHLGIGWDEAVWREVVREASS
jgi:arsenate reductase-like glutaredoxin family protein